MILLVFLFGLIIGSFLNALIWRLYNNESILKGRSHCPECNHPLGFFDLIPVLSFIIQQGKCRYCSKKISIQYPLVELSTALLFVLSATQHQFLNFSILEFLNFLIDLFFLSVLLVIFVTDLRWSLIFDKIVIPGIIVALLFQFFNFSILESFNFIIAAAIGAGIFALQFFISKGRWIGSGDIYLGGLLGLILGWPIIIYAIGLAYVVGAIVALLLIALQKKKYHDTIPLGIFLAGAGVLFVLLRF